MSRKQNGVAGYLGPTGYTRYLAKNTSWVHLSATLKGKPPAVTAAQTAISGNMARGNHTVTGALSLRN